ncbi:TROVE domain-containing protein [Alienimonas chondri]|uniref:60 kDa SS-A/Ro ribonucleoprotein n=1 Tax=Alienimonas chondri TaxID=2681879 RepID=A0ABX1V8G8_9PLAN|nr:TROVE domain-containing protein [Alienimonas chondri]NNJ24138.1 60 kDa SS-A/Ro ribonucleoprotein [Alienimonas chondri]
MKYPGLTNPRNAPQSAPANARQVKNSAGGYVYELDRWARLDRFLILGSDAPTYYTTARDLTKENRENLDACFALNPHRTAATVAAISEDGRAPKNDPAIFALAVGANHADPNARTAALAVMPRVCRTASHLFAFVNAATSLGRGWGRGLKRAVAAWYAAKSIDRLAYQGVKYRSRYDFDHARLMRLSHPDPRGDAERSVLYRWLANGSVPDGPASQRDKLPAIVRAHETAMAASPRKSLVHLIEAHRLPWEALPTWANADPAVWRAMLPHLGATALLRNLGNMTRIGALAPLSAAEDLVVERLSDAEALKQARVHPLSVLVAQAVYRSGRGVKGKGAWEPNGRVLSALDDAFRTAFDAVEPTGKRFLIGLDVSGSMTASLSGSPLSCREASAALALVTAATEPKCHVVGFTGEGGSRWRFGSPAVAPLPPLNAQASVAEAVQAVSNLPFGPTDCALPMLYALEKRLAVDVFVVLTDNETWCGEVHPSEALRRYRKQTGLDAKLAVVGLTSTGFSIADPRDAGMLDVVGFDTAVPTILSRFATGAF